MQMPTLTDEHKWLAKMAGNWVGEEIVHPGPWNPQGSKAVGRIRARMDLGGFHLISDYEHEKDGKVLFSGHGVYGYDTRGKCYTMHWFDSMGMEHGAPGLGTREGDKLTIQHETGHMGYTRYIYEAGEGRLSMRIEHAQDGVHWTPFLEAHYRRE